MGRYRDTVAPSPLTIETLAGDEIGSAHTAGVTAADSLASDEAAATPAGDDRRVEWWRKGSGHMYTSASGDVDLRQSKATGWVGWVVFAGLMLVLSGALDILWGIIALTRHQIFEGPHGNVIDLNYTTWGWIEVVWGVVVLAAGIGLFTGALWARIIAVVIASVSVIGNLLVIGAYPIWSVIVIALDVLVIYAVTVHGHEINAI